MRVRVRVRLRVRVRVRVRVRLSVRVRVRVRVRVWVRLRLRVWVRVRVRVRDSVGVRTALVVAQREGELAVVHAIRQEQAHVRALDLGGPLLPAQHEAGGAEPDHTRLLPPLGVQRHAQRALERRAERLALG